LDPVLMATISIGLWVGGAAVLPSPLLRTLHQRRTAAAAVL